MLLPTWVSSRGVRAPGRPKKARCQCRSAVKRWKGDPGLPRRQVELPSQAPYPDAVSCDELAEGGCSAILSTERLCGRPVAPGREVCGSHADRLFRLTMPPQS